MELKDFTLHEMNYSPPNKVVKSLRVCYPVEAHLEAMAEETDLSQPRLMRLALYEFLERNGRKPYVLP